MAFRETCILCFIVPDVKSSPMADLLVGDQCFIQKNFVDVYSENAYDLSKLSQGLRSAEMVSEVSDGQKNKMSAGKLCSQ